MPDDRWIWQCDYAVPNDLEGARRIGEQLLGQLELHGWSQHDRFSVQVALEEALANAVCHGNKFDPAKHLCLSFRLNGQKVRIEITDEGSGFNPDAVPDPTDAGRLDRPNGRGLSLMRAFMSRVEFCDCGRRLVLVKERACKH